MSIVLTRIDDRLIHGQVVVGWVQALNAKRIVLIDDEVRGNKWEQDLYALGVPGGVEVVFMSVSEAIEAVTEMNGDAIRTVFLIANVETARRLCDGTDIITHVNVGGLHDGNGRSERLSYVYLSDDEAALLLQIRDGGVEVTAQDVPTAKAVALEHWA